MAHSANSIVANGSTDRADNRPTGSAIGPTDRSFLIDFMCVVRTWFPHKASAELAQIIGCDVRTAERYFAGERTPDALALMKLLRSEHGAKMIEAAVADLPPNAQRKFWKELTDAVLRRRLSNDE